MKKTIQLFTILCFVLFWGQGNFEYQRTWGTFYGPTVGDMSSASSQVEYLTKGFIYNNHLYFHKGVENIYAFDNTFNTDYYNQYITEGNGIDVMTDYQTILNFKISTDGALEQAVYQENFTANYQEHLIGIDNAGNQFFTLTTSSQSITANANVWLSSLPQELQEDENRTLLIKKSESGNTLWKTFLPTEEMFDKITDNIVFDEENNIYLYLSTKVQEGIGTTGTFQEDFFESTNNSNNSCIVKLNPHGQLVWGSYLPVKKNTNSFGNQDIAYYNHNLYLSFDSRISGSTTDLSTSNTFQQNYAKGGIIKLDANTGGRIWGTYYHSNSTMPEELTHIKANETGVYAIGVVMTDKRFGSAAGSYYATQNAHQTISNGGWEITITKFNDSGNRVWGTYYGTASSMAGVEAVYDIALAGNKLFLTGVTDSEESIATEGAFNETIPNNYLKGFFLEFNTNGELQWCSYLGEYGMYGSIEAVDENQFYVWGVTSTIGNIPSENAIQSSNMPQYNNDSPTMFVMRFDSTNLATSEVDLTEDLVLYDNPNDGHFSIKGKILAQGKYNIKLYDTAGRLVFQKNLTPKDTHSFDLRNQLLKGNYLLKLTKDQETIKTFKLLINEN